MLLGQQLPHALQGGGHVHPHPGLLLGEGEGAGGRVIPGDFRVLGLYQAGLGGLLQLLLPLLGQVHHIGQVQLLGAAVFQQLWQLQVQHVLRGEVLPLEEHGVLFKLHRDLQLFHGLRHRLPGDGQGLLGGLAPDVLPADGGPFREHPFGGLAHLGRRALLFLLVEERAPRPAQGQEQGGGRRNQEPGPKSFVPLHFHIRPFRD